MRCHRGVLGLFLLAGLARAEPSDSPAVVSDEPGLARDLEPLARAVADLHGGTWQSPVKIRVLDDAEWKALPGPPRSSTEAALDAWLEAFGLEESRETYGDSIRRFRVEQTLAFYDPDQEQIGIRRSVLWHGLNARGMLHELAHAYRFQGTGMQKLAPPTSLDALLARRAVNEGHAELVSELLEGAANELPASRTVELVRALLPPAGFAGLRALLEGGGGVLLPFALLSPGTAGTIASIPYVAGARFMLGVYAAGGMHHVRSVLTSPPTSTRAVLHPDLFLRGELPWTSAPDRAAVMSEPLGEALVLVALEQCTSPMGARRLAAAYRGDLGTLSGRRGDARLEWHSWWQDEGAAVEVGRILSRCPALLAGGRKAGLTGEPVTAVDGSHLVLVRGSGDANAEASLHRRVALPGRVRSPLGRTIPPVSYVLSGVPLDGHWQRGTRTYASGKIGLKLTVPEKAELQIPSPSGVLSVSGKAPRFFTTVSAFRAPKRDGFFDALEDVALAGVEGRGDLFEEDERGEVSLSGMRALQSSWHRAAERMRLRSISLCDGKVLVLFLSRWSDPAGLAAADAFEASAWWAPDRDCDLSRH